MVQAQALCEEIFMAMHTAQQHNLNVSTADAGLTNQHAGSAMSLRSGHSPAAAMGNHFFSAVTMPAGLSRTVLENSHRPICSLAKVASHFSAGIARFGIAAPSRNFGGVAVGRSLRGILSVIGKFI